jgi:hypothetical protein
MLDSENLAVLNTEGVVKSWVVFPGKAKMRAEAQFTRSK